MKNLGCLIGLTIATLGAPFAQGAVYSMGDPGTGILVPTNFTFGADASGGGILSLVNSSGFLWQNLLITVTEPDGTAITILPNPFFNTEEFSSQSLGNGTSLYSIGLFNTGISFPGVTNGEAFTINLNDFLPGTNTQSTDPNGSGGWGPDTNFVGAANSVPGAIGTVPEPASLFLLAVGLGIVGSARRRFQRRA